MNSRNSNHRIFVMSVAIAISSFSVGHTAEIIVGDHQLQPNATEQIVQIPISGGEAISGLDLFVQIGDGGPELQNLGLPRGSVGPTISDVELINDTIFDGVFDLPTDIGLSDLKQTAFYTLALVGDVQNVMATGILVQLTLDTSGLYFGEWDLRLKDVLPFDEFGGPYSTNLAGNSVRVENGRLRIPVSVGDFNKDQELDALDIDFLSAAIRAGEEPLLLDLTEDGQVDESDLFFWVEIIRRTSFGDANLDGEFGTGDLVDVFVAAEYEDGIALNSNWSTGDWNADAEFNTSDLVIAFQRGKFEAQSRTAHVPEPAGTLPCALVFLLAYTRRMRAVFAA